MILFLLSNRNKKETPNTTNLTKGNGSFVLMIQLREARLTDIPLIQELTNQIWPLTYGHIISKEQISFMLKMMYSTESLKNQLTQENLRFYIITLNGKPVGYTSCELHLEPKTAKIHKLYLSHDLHGKGYGKIVVTQLEEVVAQNNNEYLILHVNRHNTAVDFYKRIGFEIIKEEDINIGNDYFMNDYVMRKKLAPIK